jgi:Tol biopolymer transport system component
MEIAVQTPAWSTDRQALAVTLTDSASTANPRNVPAVVSFDETFSLRLAAWQGHSPALSPDGRWLAYLTFQTSGSLATVPGEARVDILDLETGAVNTALALADLPASRPFDQLLALSWSPDGARLALVARRGGTDHLFDLRMTGAAPGQVDAISEIAVPTASFRLVGFSADSQYLAVANDLFPTTRLVVLDLGAPARPAFEANASSAAWSPTGHQLAIANAAGLYIADPLTGETQWVKGGDCAPSWHDLH